MLAVHAKGEEMGTTLFDRRYSDSPMTYLTFRGPLLLLPNQTATTKTSIVTPSDTIRVLLQKRTLPHCYLFPCTCLLPFIGRCYFFFRLFIETETRSPEDATPKVRYYLQPLEIRYGCRVRWCFFWFIVTSSDSFFPF